MYGLWEGNGEIKNVNLWLEEKDFSVFDFFG